MDKDTTRWLTLVAVVLILGVGVWWAFGGTGSQTPGPGNGMATTTSETSGAGGITVRNSPGTVAQVIADLEYGGRFSQLLSNTGVGTSLTGSGPFTVFVATDGAFGRLIPGTVNSLNATEQRRLMQYHVVVGKRLDVDIVNNGQIEALSRDTLNFHVDDRKRVFVNSGYVLDAYNATNGIVYVINSVLIPPVTEQ